jgi:hypothetical protein
VMDALTDGVPAPELPRTRNRVKISRPSEHCAWTSDSCDFGTDQVRRWNGIQNTPNDVRLLPAT